MTFDHKEKFYASELAQELGLKETIGIAIGAMIGGGIFTALGFVATLAGPGGIISFAIGGLIAILTSVSYVKLVADYPSSGGEYIILRKSYNNPLIGNSIGLLLWLGYSVTVALYAFTFGIYLSEFLASTTGNHILFGTSAQPALFSMQRLFSAFVIFLFMSINLKGVKETGLIQNIIVAFKLGVLLMFGAIGLFFVKTENLTPFMPNGIFPVFIGAAAVFVSYEGFQVIANTVEEMKNAGRDVKLGMYASVLIVAFTYILVAFVAIGMSTDASNFNEKALIELVRPWGAFAVFMITMGAVASTSSAINATLLGSSRLAYTMSQWRGFPGQLAVINEKTKVPYLSIINTAIFSWILTFLGDVVSIANSGSIIFLLIFLVINVTAIKNYRSERNLIPIFTSILIIMYLIIDLYFIIHEGKIFAIVILGVFILLDIGWQFVNFYLNKRRSEFIPPPIPQPMKSALERKKIPVFEEYEDPTGIYFDKLERVLVPISGKRHEIQAINLALAISSNYDLSLDFVNIGENPDVFAYPKKLLKNTSIKHRWIQEKGINVLDKLLQIYNRSDYQLIIMGSRRQNSIIDRLFQTSMTKKVVENVDCSVLQVHPARYGLRYEDIRNMLVLMRGDKRDAYLARWAKILDSFGRKSEIFAYHVLRIPMTVPLEGISEHPSILESNKNFKEYVQKISNMISLRNVEPIILFGRNFSRSIISATLSREPDAILIGHSPETSKLRKPLAYRILNQVDCVLIVFHTGKLQVT